MARKNTFNIPAEGWVSVHFFNVSMLNLKLKSPSGTSFGLYFAYKEYCSDYSNSPAEWNFSPVEITGMLDSQSVESFSIGSPLLTGLT